MWQQDTDHSRSGTSAERVHRNLLPAFGALLLDGSAVLAVFLLLSCRAIARCWHTGLAVRADMREQSFRRSRKNRAEAEALATALRGDHLYATTMKRSPSWPPRSG